MGELRASVTVTDILEAIVGDVPTSSPADESLAVRRDNGSWLVDGTMPFYELEELLGIPKLPRETDGAFTTVGGFVMAFLGKVPQPTDHSAWDGRRFEVIDMDRNRVRKVLANPVGDVDSAEAD
jgi:putative hemolysin